MRAHRCVYIKDREAAPVFGAEDQEPMEGRAWWQRWEGMRSKAPAGVGKEGLQPALQHGGSHWKEWECVHSRTGRHSEQHIDSVERQTYIQTPALSRARWVALTRSLHL